MAAIAHGALEKRLHLMVNHDAGRTRLEFKEF
jgi:hypothetical protein